MSARRFTSTSTYTITGRGLLRSIVEPDPILQRGDVIEIDGIEGRVHALERYAIEPQPGRPVGVLFSADDVTPPKRVREE